MKRKATILFSEQAKTLLSEMNLDKENILDWFCNKRKIYIGGGDIVDYIKVRGND